MILCILASCGRMPIKYDTAADLSIRAANTIGIHLIPPIDEAAQPVNR